MPADGNDTIPAAIDGIGNPERGENGDRGVGVMESECVISNLWDRILLYTAMPYLRLSLRFSLVAWPNEKEKRPSDGQ